MTDCKRVTPKDIDALLRGEPVECVMSMHYGEPCIALGDVIVCREHGAAVAKARLCRVKVESVREITDTDTGARMSRVTMSTAHDVLTHTIALGPQVFEPIGRGLQTGLMVKERGMVPGDTIVLVEALEDGEAGARVTGTITHVVRHHMACPDWNHVYWAVTEEGTR